MLSTSPRLASPPLSPSGRALAPAAASPAPRTSAAADANPAARAGGRASASPLSSRNTTSKILFFFFFFPPSFPPPKCGSGRARRAPAAGRRRSGLGARGGGREEEPGAASTSCRGNGGAPRAAPGAGARVRRRACPRGPRRAYQRGASTRRPSLRPSRAQHRAGGSVRVPHRAVGLFQVALTALLLLGGFTLFASCVVFTWRLSPPSRLATLAALRRLQPRPRSDDVSLPRQFHNRDLLLMHFCWRRQRRRSGIGGTQAFCPRV